MTKFEKEVKAKVGTVAGKKGDIAYLTAGQRNLARQRMQAALFEHKPKPDDLISVKEVEVVLQDALEKFAADVLKTKVDWWRLTDYDDIFDYLCFGDHTVLETVDHFAAELSLSVEEFGAPTTVVLPK